MARLSLSKAWDESKRIYARDGSLLSAVALALLVLPEIVAGLFAPSNQGSPSGGASVVVLIAAFIGVIGQLAIVRLALGPSTTVAQAIGHGARRFPATLGALALLILAMLIVLLPVTALLVALGLLQLPIEGQQPSGAFGLAAFLLLIAILLIAVRFIMSVPVASAERAGPVGILKRSWALTRGRYGTLLALELLLILAAVVLLLAAQVVGGVLARIAGDEIAPFTLAALILAIVVSLAQAAFTVFATVMLARVYAQLAGEGSGAEVGVPRSGT